MIKRRTVGPTLSDQRGYRFMILVAAVGWLLGFNFVRAQPPESKPDHRFEIVVPAAGGVVQWQDVAESIAHSMTLDADSVKQMLPGGSIDLRSDTVMLMLLGLNLTFDDALSIDITRDSKDQPTLRLRCRRDAFAEALPATRKAEPKLHLDQDWHKKIGERPLVICIHGLKGQWSAFDGFRAYLRGQRFPTAAVSYDFDQAIEVSSRQIAELVASRLKNFPTRKRSADESGQSTLEIAVVGHSMGGLVAREWVENPAIDSSHLSHVFTVATPHGGSNWASLPPMLNIVTGDVFAPQDLVDILLHQPTSQGLRDLQPGSEQLKRMATRHRSDHVAYTTIVGTRSGVNHSDLSTLRDSLIELDRNGSFVRLIRPRIKPFLEGFDELVDGKGDGIVSIENAQLAGVEDVVFVPLSHGDMFQPVNHGEHPVWRAILERLSPANVPPGIRN